MLSPLRQHGEDASVVEVDASMSGRSPVVASMRSSVRSITERLRSPRKSIFKQAEVRHPVHLVLGDDRRVGRVGAGLGLALDRQVLGQRRRG